MITKKQKCPVCGRMYTQAPAISRKDNATLICPDCGVDEALDAMFGSNYETEAQKTMRSQIHRIMKEAGCGNG